MVLLRVLPPQVLPDELARREDHHAGVRAAVQQVPVAGDQHPSGGCRRWGVRVGPQTGWRWLVALGFSLQVPRPSHPRSADPTTRRRWDKILRQRLARRRRARPGRRVEVWAEDEARLGLEPVTRRAWSLRGRRPRCGGRAGFVWLYVDGFARPRTGQTFCVLLPRVNTDRVADALAAFAAHADPNGAKVLVVVVDSAGWHVARRLVVPPNVVLHFLPPCTPELQPVEPFWPLVREAVANRSIGRIDRLRAILRTRLGYLARNPGVVQPVVGFHWTRCLGREQRPA